MAWFFFRQTGWPQAASSGHYSGRYIFAPGDTFSGYRAIHIRIPVLTSSMSLKVSPQRSWKHCERLHRGQVMGQSYEYGVIVSYRCFTNGKATIFSIYTK